MRSACHWFGADEFFFGAAANSQQLDISQRFAHDGCNGCPNERAAFGAAVRRKSALSGTRIRRSTPQDSALSALRATR